MDNNSKSTSKGLFSFGNVITVILLIAVIIGYVGSKSNWFRITSTQGESTVEINSLDELNNSLSYAVSFPDFVNKAITNGSQPIGTVKQSNFSEFKVDNTIIGTCKFVGYGVDPLDLKSKMYNVDEEDNETLISTVEINKFSIDNNNINHIEYVYNLPDFENCTLIIWSDNSANYSMLFGDKVSQETILENWNIEPKDITEYVDDEETEETDNEASNNKVVDELNFNKLTSTHLSIALPDGFEVMESDGYDIYSLGGKMLLAVMYTEDAISGESFTGSGEISVTDTIVLRYNKENPFETGTNYYNTYNKVLESIGKVAGSIEFTE